MHRSGFHRIYLTFGLFWFYTWKDEQETVCVWITCKWHFTLVFPYHAGHAANAGRSDTGYWQLQHWRFCWPGHVSTIFWVACEAEMEVLLQGHFGVILALLFLCCISVEATKPEDTSLMFQVVVWGLLSPPWGASVPTEELQHLLVFVDSSFFYLILLSSTSEMKNFAWFKTKKSLSLKYLNVNDT